VQTRHNPPINTEAFEVLSCETAESVCGIGADKLYRIGSVKVDPFYQKGVIHRQGIDTIALGLRVRLEDDNIAVVYLFAYHAVPGHIYRFKGLRGAIRDKGT
jgi:hypothetical protein